MVLGALCLLDTEPRKLNEEELGLLDTMAADVVSVITGDDTPESEIRSARESANPQSGATPASSAPDADTEVRP
jgi:hypothetical protein